MIFFVLKYEIMKMKVKRRLEKIQTAYIDAMAFFYVKCLRDASITKNICFPEDMNVCVRQRND